MKRIHNNITNETLRKENDDFNQDFIESMGLKFSEIITPDQFNLSVEKTLDSSPCMVVWLKNIDRIFSLLSKKLPLKNYSFLDIGCGTGIASIYIANKYIFKSFSGFDFDPILVKKAKQNREIAIVEKLPRIDFFVQDSREIVLIKQPTFLFMFNPFGKETMNEFLQNNLDTISETKSIICYINDIHIEIFDQLDCTIVRDDYFNLSLIYF